MVKKISFRKNYNGRLDKVNPFHSTKEILPNEINLIP
jgi:hypothetical protein